MHFALFLLLVGMPAVYAERGSSITLKKTAPYGWPSGCLQILQGVVAHSEDEPRTRILRDWLLDDHHLSSQARADLITLSFELEHAFEERETPERTETIQRLRSQIRNLIKDHRRDWIPFMARSLSDWRNFSKGVLTRAEIRLYGETDEEISQERQRKFALLAQQIPTLRRLSSESLMDHPSLAERARSDILEDLRTSIGDSLSLTVKRQAIVAKLSGATLLKRIGKTHLTIRTTWNIPEEAEPIRDVTFGVYDFEGALLKLYFTDRDGWLDIPVSDLGPGHTLRLLGG